MTATSPQPPTATASEDLGFPEGQVSYEGPLSGLLPGTLLRMEPARRPEKPNQWGKTPLSSKFVWALDVYPEYEIWTYINVEARGKLSGLFAVFQALTGETLTVNTPLAEIYALAGRRCNLLIEQSTSNPGFPHIRSMHRIEPPRGGGRAQGPSSPPPAPSPEHARELEDEFNDVPF